MGLIACLFTSSKSSKRYYRSATFFIKSLFGIVNSEVMYTEYTITELFQRLEQPMMLELLTELSVRRTSTSAVLFSSV